MNAEALKSEILKAQSEGDIAALYLLEQRAHDVFGEEELVAYYANILDLALENLTTALESAKRFKLDEVQDYATVRALYEYAIEHYSAGSLSDAAALFEILEGISEDRAFQEAIKRHTRCANDQIAFERFIDEIADLDATQEAQSFYICAFKA
ncbi:MAG: hypothetical protein JXK05_02580 [Campylobacterales bacterium]|nr:hypothetical protein [Campylobacterales bacterium]